jgi:citrate synthase
MEEVLFQVTKDQLESGMRGYPVGYCPTSFIDSKKGLFYRGRSIEKLYTWDVERVIYLLYYGREGSSQDILHFSQELKKRASCLDATAQQIESLPRDGDPMKLFTLALLLVGMLEGKGDYCEDCFDLIAKVSHLVALVINYHAGWGKTPAPDKTKGYIENFVSMLRVPDADKEKLEEVMRLFMILHFDHGGGNLSAFVGKAVASGLEDLYGSLSGAMCALSGALHGKANQNGLLLVRSILEEVGEEATPYQIEEFVRKRMEEKGLIFGFGHAVLRVEDPRATILYTYAKEHFPDHPIIKIALLLRTKGPKVLKESPKISNPYPNVDAISGALLAASGFDYPEYFPVLFGLARIVGIAIQIVYERCQARGGKGTPLVRPTYLYLPEKR